MGATSVKNGQEIYRGAIADFKWGGKTFYEGEVLAVSGKLCVGRTVASLNTSLSVFRLPMIVIVCFFVVDNRQSLNHDLDKLTKLELTREEILARSESVVHTTSPEKKKPVTKKQSKSKERASNKKRELDAKLSAANKRLRGEIF